MLLRTQEVLVKKLLFIKSCNGCRNCFPRKNSTTIVVITWESLKQVFSQRNCTKIRVYVIHQHKKVAYKQQPLRIESVSYKIQGRENKLKATKIIFVHALSSSLSKAMLRDLCMRLRLERDFIWLQQQQQRQLLI